VPNATTTATGTFEQTIVADTTNFTFYFQPDVSHMNNPMISAGPLTDLVEFRLYTFDSGQTTYIQTWKGTYQYAQVNSQKASPFVPSDAGIRATVKQLTVAATTTSVTFVSGGSANITLTSCNLQVGDTVVFTGTTAPTSSPAGFALNTSYFVVTATATNFQVSTTAGGTAYTFSTTGTAVSVNLTGRQYRWKMLKQ
jgi:hypothetical protein